MGILGRASEQLPSCLRDSLFLGCHFYASGVGPLLVERNFVDDVSNDGIKAMNARQQLLVRNNIINCQGGEGIRVLPSLNLNVEIASNTLPEGRIAIPAFPQEHTLSCHHNVMGAMLIPSNRAVTAQADVEIMRSRYNVAGAVHDNMITFDSVAADVRGVNVIARDPSLSTDVAARDAFRVTTADAVNVGALPPGPAPAQGDWFTRLQERFREIAVSPGQR